MVTPNMVTPNMVTPNLVRSTSISSLSIQINPIYNQSYDGYIDQFNSPSSSVQSLTSLSPSIRNQGLEILTNYEFNTYTPNINEDENDDDDDDDDDNDD